MLILLVNQAMGQSKSSSESPQATLDSQTASQPVRGIIFHCCSCAVPCSCMFTTKQVDGCNIVRIYHITDGGYMGKDFAGLTLIVVPHPPELKNKKGGLRNKGAIIDSILYLPLGITKLQELKVPGLLADNSMNFGISQSLQRHALIRFRKQADGYEVEIPGIFHARVQSITGANKKQIVMDNLDLDGGSRWYLGRSILHNYQDNAEKKWHWQLPKSNGSWSFFEWGPHIDPSDEVEGNRKGTL